MGVDNAAREYEPRAGWQDDPSNLELVGVLIRRTVPAMAATAAAWLAVVVPSMIWLRPLIEKPITVMGILGKGAGTVAGRVGYATRTPRMTTAAGVARISGLARGSAS